MGPAAARHAFSDRAERAERYLITALPDLDPAVRRVLALVELGGHDRDAAATATGLDGDAVARALAQGRKALRGAREPLRSTGRCERAERLISDRLDGPLADPGPARLAAHLGRCPRCSRHERALDEAREALRAGFAASNAVEPAPAAPPAGPRQAPPEPPAPPPPPAPPDPPAAREVPAARPRLTVIPGLLPDAPTALPPGEERAELPAAAPEEPPAREPPAPEPPIPPEPEVARRKNRTARRIAVAAVVLALAGGGTVAAVALIDGGNDHPQPTVAPWDRHDAPVVPPPSLDGQ